MELEPDSTSPERGTFLQRLNFPFLLVAIITGFIALSSEAWWTVRAIGPGSILNVQVSPFYVKIDAFGINPTMPYVLTLGTATRVLLAVTSIALAFAALHPKSVWRKLVFWLGLSSLVEVYLSFSLLLHSTQVILLDSYGTIPPLSGNAVIQGRILGLDLNTYVNPTISSSFTFPFFLGLASITLLGGSEILQFMLHSRLDLVSSELVKGLGGVYLSPPYLHAWFTSSDRTLNPLSQDPDNLTDDELALSFEKILARMQPGGVVSIILPRWALALGERLAKVVPWTGFRLEKSELVYRVPGQIENELIFRKPESPPRVREEPKAEVSNPLEHVESVPREVEGTPLAEMVEEPVWAERKLSRQEMAMVKSAAGIIERRREPVPYRELLSEVYMDLLDKRVNFGSARQIETTLLKHVGKELALIDDLDGASLKPGRKWWLGEKGLQAEATRTRHLLSRLSTASRSIPKVRLLVREWRQKHHAGYVPRRQADDD